jgi:hypothetical protein
MFGQHRAAAKAVTVDRADGRQPLPRRNESGAPEREDELQNETTRRPRMRFHLDGCSGPRQMEHRADRQGRREMTAVRLVEYPDVTSAPVHR